MKKILLCSVFFVQSVIGGSSANSRGDYTPKEALRKSLNLPVKSIFNSASSSSGSAASSNDAGLILSNSSPAASNDDNDDDETNFENTGFPVDEKRVDRALINEAIQNANNQTPPTPPTAPAPTPKRKLANITAKTPIHVIAKTIIKAGARPRKVEVWQQAVAVKQQLQVIEEQENFVRHLAQSSAKSFFNTGCSAAGQVIFSFLATKGCDAFEKNFWPDETKQQIEQIQLRRLAQNVRNEEDAAEIQRRQADLHLREQEIPLKILEAKLKWDDQVLYWNEIEKTQVLTPQQTQARAFAVKKSEECNNLLNTLIGSAKAA